MANSVRQSLESVEIKSVKVWMVCFEKSHELFPRQVIVVQCCRAIDGPGNEMGYQLFGMRHTDGDDVPTHPASAFNDPSQLNFLWCSRV